MMVLKRHTSRVVGKWALEALLIEARTPVLHLRASTALPAAANDTNAPVVEQTPPWTLSMSSGQELAPELDAILASLAGD